MALHRTTWIDEANEEIRIREDLMREVTRLKRRISELTSSSPPRLQGSEEKFQAIFDAVRDPIFLKDCERKYILVNPEMELLLGRPSEEIIGKTHGELFGNPDTDPMDLIDRRVLAGKVVDQEYTRPDSDHPKTYHVVKVPAYDHSGHIAGICGVARDMTRWHKLKAQMEQSRRLESIAALAGGVAHEFNNALMVVNAKIEMLRLAYPDDLQMEQHIETLMRSTRRMTHLTDQLLAYARGGKYEPKTISWRRFIAETIAAMGMDIDPGISMDVKLADADTRVEADQTQLRMVITSIVSNATEAIQGAGTIRVRCGMAQMRPPVEKDGKSVAPYAWLVVEDTGADMDKATRSRIFEPFFTTKFQGRGLGMAAVYGIVKNHNGWITVDSDPGLGTRVCMGLPARCAPAAT